MRRTGRRNDNINIDFVGKSFEDQLAVFVTCCGWCSWSQDSSLDAVVATLPSGRPTNRSIPGSGGDFLFVEPTQPPARWISTVSCRGPEYVQFLSRVHGMVS
jgi:hypothetical protein